MTIKTMQDYLDALDAYYQGPIHQDVRAARYNLYGNLGDYCTTMLQYHAIGQMPRPDLLAFQLGQVLDAVVSDAQQNLSDEQMALFGEVMLAEDTQLHSFRASLHESTFWETWIANGLYTDLFNQPIAGAYIRNVQHLKPLARTLGTSLAEIAEKHVQDLKEEN
jgi:hypothetical protein